VHDRILSVNDQRRIMPEPAVIKKHNGKPGAVFGKLPEEKPDRIFRTDRNPEFIIG